MADTASLVLRIVVGMIFIAQGYRKLFAAPDAHHGRANLVAMIENRGLPYPGRLAFASSTVELVCGSFVLIGLLTRVFVVPLIAVLVPAILLFKIRDGFIGGWDWPLSVLGGSVAILLLGGGDYSIDGLR